MPDSFCVTGPLYQANSVSHVLRELLWWLNYCGAAVRGVNTGERVDHPSFKVRLRHLVDKPAGEHELAVFYSGHGEDRVTGDRVRLEVPDSFLATGAEVKRWNESPNWGIVAPSPAAADYFTERGVNEVVMIPHGYNPRLVKPVPARFTPQQLKLLHKFGWLRPGRLDDKTFIIGHTGFLQPRKGTIELVQAVCEAFGPRDNVVLLMHGPAPGGQPLDWGQPLQHFQGTNVLQRIAGQWRVPGILYSDALLTPEEMRQLRGLFDLAVFPSFYEGFGLVPLECLAQGVEVLVPRHSGFCGLEPITGGPKVHWLERGTPEPAVNPAVKENVGLIWHRPDIGELAEQLAALREESVPQRFGRRPTRYPLFEGLTWQAAAEGFIESFGVPRQSVASPASSRKVSVAILTIKKPEMAIAAAKSVALQPDAVGIVLDNGLASADEKQQLARGLDGVAELRTGDPRLGVVARNLVWMTAVTPYVACLDDDATMAPNVVREVVDYFEDHPEVGLVGVKSVLSNGSIDSFGASIDLQHKCGHHPHSGEQDGPAFAVAREFPYSPGVCLVARTEVVRAVGGFREEYAPLWCEDVDFAEAVKAAGWEVHVIGSCHVTHNPHQSSAGRNKECDKKVDLFAAWWGWAFEERER